MKQRRDDHEPFRTGPDVRTIADMNWAAMASDEHSLSRGFKEAADEVVHAVKRSRLSTELMFYPVAYSYRHALELLLKGIVCSLANLSDEDERPTELLGGHNLMRLWNWIRESSTKQSLELPAEDRKQLTKLVQAFHVLDKSGQEFRYPRSKDGRRYLAKIPALVSLDSLKETMTAAYDLLKGWAYYLEHLESSAAEYEAEMRVEYEAEMRAEYEAEMRAYEAEMRAEYEADLGPEY